MELASQAASRPAPSRAVLLLGLASQAAGAAVGAAVWSVQRAQSRAASVASGITAGVGGLLNAAYNTPGAVIARATSARQLVAQSYDHLRREGVSVWSADLLRSTGELVNHTATDAYAATGDRMIVTRAQLAGGAAVARRRAAAAATGARLHTVAAAKTAGTAARDLSVAGRRLASEKSFQATFVSATGGAVACATGGGVTGMIVGGGLGAAAGLPMALVTFGLSIPVGAVLGGGAGLATGATIGAGAGAVGGGAMGYGAYSRRAQIGAAANKVAAKADEVRGAAQKSIANLGSAAAGARGRARPERAGTGSTDGMD